MSVHFASNRTINSYYRGFKAVITAVVSGAAVSNMTTTSQPTNSFSWSCNFEEQKLCGMTQSKKDEFDWTIQSGKTRSDPTGPNAASEGQFYAYIETSNPRKPGDRAELLLPILEHRGDYCLTFDYHMFGFHVNTLMIQKYGQSGTETIWERSKDHGNQWMSAEVNLDLEADGQVSFIGVRGGEYTGDIAIDDLHITTGKC